ncbi:hypothetical protein POTOM_027200 [Populus tomentosa]|uniref:Thioredoxin-like protein YLS8 n=1 Tax=Populus tomentosa TaxID=118781 RepID=A0A8X7ZEA8_POPTO|nr:hypothetical protein POTOM_027200 [Populus tomentosa]
MSYLLPHLHSGWAVDQAILAEEERVVIIRFGHDWDDTCMQVPNPPLSASSSFFPVLMFFMTTNIVTLCNGKLDHAIVEKSSPREREMSYLLPHLHSGWAVDQAILAEEERLVVIRFGHDWDETCMQNQQILVADVLVYVVFCKVRSFAYLESQLLEMDEVLASVAETIKNFAVIYLVDITEVPDFNTMYELYDPSTVMFFFRNKHIMIDLGTGNNNKINWALKDKQEFIDIVETVYRGARKGRGLVIAPKDYSTKRGDALVNSKSYVVILVGVDNQFHALDMDDALNSTTILELKQYSFMFLITILKRHCIAANRECSQQVSYKINLGIARCGYEPADISAALLVGCEKSSAQ